MTDWSKLPEIVKAAKVAAAEKPGRYGGRYVARRYRNGATEIAVLDDDDPEAIQHTDWDVLAQVTPTAVHGIGSIARYMDDGGNVSFDN